MAKYQNKQLWLACLMYGTVLILQDSVSVHLTHHPSERFQHCSHQPTEPQRQRLDQQEYRAENEHADLNVICSARQVCAAFACQVKGNETRHDS